MTVDAYASRSHYVEHLAPVWQELGDLAGTFHVAPPAEAAAAQHGIRTAPLPARGAAPRLYGPDGAALVAAGQDMYHARHAGHRRVIRMEHGAGQSYMPELDHPSYAGGQGNNDVVLFLTPNDYSAARWRATYPKARVEVIGSPFMEGLPAWDRIAARSVMVTFRWGTSLLPELQSALPHYRGALAGLAARYPVIGHGHPRAIGALESVYGDVGITIVTDYREALRRSAVVIADNTSAIYEAAATGRRVVVLDAPWYRRTVEHGLRFWEAADVDLRIDHPSSLVGAVARAFMGRYPHEYERRDRVLSLVYAHRTGSALRAADAIRSLFG